LLEDAFVAKSEVRSSKVPTRRDASCRYSPKEDGGDIMINDEIPCIACMDEYAKKVMILMFIMTLYAF
jgi:hypothetical protein